MIQETTHHVEQSMAVISFSLSKIHMGSVLRKISLVLSLLWNQQREKDPPERNVVLAWQMKKDTYIKRGKFTIHT